MRQVKLHSGALQEALCTCGRSSSLSNSTSVTTSSPLHCALFDSGSSSENKEMLFNLHIFYEWKYKVQTAICLVGPTFSTGGDYVIHLAFSFLIPC